MPIPKVTAFAFLLSITQQVKGNVRRFYIKLHCTKNQVFYEGFLQ